LFFQAVPSAREIFEMAQMQSRRQAGLLYLQDLLDDVARADAEWFARLCLNGEGLSRSQSEARNVRSQVLPPVQEQAA
jgi:hypothetical protein